MKNLLTLITIGLLSLSAFATGDQEEVILDCHPQVLRPDVGMNLQMLTGGLAGLTRVTITRYFLGHSQVENYIVNQKPLDPHRAGAPVIYAGKGISLSINYTTSPRHDGLRLSTLVTKQAGAETLLCKAN